MKRGRVVRGRWRRPEEKEEGGPGKREEEIGGNDRETKTGR